MLMVSVGWEFTKGSAGQFWGSHVVAVRRWLEGPFRAVSPHGLAWASLHHGCHPLYTVAADFENKYSSKQSGSCMVFVSLALEVTPGLFCHASLVEPATKVHLV